MIIINGFEKDTKVNQCVYYNRHNFDFVLGTYIIAVIMFFK